MFNKVLVKENSLKAKLIVSVMIALMLIAPGISVRGQDDTTGIKEIRGLLSRFTVLKTAITEGDTTQVTKKLEDFIKILNTIDYKLISEGNIHILLKDATIISESGSPENQEKAFANLSNNIDILARSFNLSDSLR